MHKEKYYDVPSDDEDDDFNASDDDDDDDDLCEEARILRDHPITDGLGNGFVDFPDKQQRKEARSDVLNEIFQQELDAFLNSGGGFTQNRSDFTDLPEHLLKSVGLAMDSMPEAHVPDLSNLPTFKDMESFVASLKDPVVCCILSARQHGNGRFQRGSKESTFLDASVEGIRRAHSLCPMLRRAGSVSP